MKQDMATALFNGYLALVRVLHRNGSLNVSDLTNELGNTIDFRRIHGWETPEDQQLFEILYKAVQDIEQLSAEQAARLAALQTQIDAARGSSPPDHA